MAFTTPKTGFIASEGFAYTDINKTNENIRVLAGGDNTLPMSTDAATASALAKRDADGDIAFRDIVARNIVASGSFSCVSITCTAGEYVLDSFDNEVFDSGTGGVYEEQTRRLYCSRSGVVRIRFRMRAHTAGSSEKAKIFKNGSSAGTERVNTTTSWVEYTEDLSVVAGDYFSIFGLVSGYGIYVDRFRISVAEVL